MIEVWLIVIAVAGEARGPEVQNEYGTTSLFVSGEECRDFLARAGTERKGHTRSCVRFRSEQGDKP
jgi:hypothetical protein